MSRHLGPKNKLARRANLDLNLKTNPAKLARRLNIPPGQHGRKGGKKPSDYGIQLREKQKVKWFYGVLEAQFRNYYEKATKNPAATGEELLRLLERRLDNVVYRLGLAPTRPAARQMIVHGHVIVNGQKIDRPSYQLKPGDTVTLTNQGLKIPAVKNLLDQKGLNPPGWLTKKAVVGKVVALPERADIQLDVNENLIVEYYSR